MITSINIPSPVKTISSTTDIDFIISPIMNPIVSNNRKHRVLFIFFFI